MSKSLGNFFTVRDLLDQGVPGEVIRFVMLSTHYGKPMDWTEKKRAEAEATLRKWRSQTRNVIPADAPLDQVLHYLFDDLNTAGAISELHQLSHAFDSPNLLASAQALGLLTHELGGWEDTGPADGADLSRLDEIRRWLEVAREDAQLSMDFLHVDRLKRDLAVAGVEVRMTKTAVALLPTPFFQSGSLWAIKSYREGLQ